MGGNIEVISVRLRSGSLNRFAAKRECGENLKCNGPPNRGEDRHNARKKQIHDY